MATVKEVVDAFERGQYATVEQLLQNIVDRRNINNTTINQTKPETKQTKIDTAYPWLYDVGVGPITNGLGALQVLSDAVAGARWEAFKIFDTYKVLYTPNDIKKADESFALVIILENLGMLDYYNTAKTINTTESNKLKDLCLTIHKRIKSGAFNKSDFEQRVLSACKSVIRVTINYRQVI